MAPVKESMKWLIVGGDGQLGLAMKAELAEFGKEFVSLSRSQLDITNGEEISDVFKRIRPDVVLNAAAWTRVDDAENAEMEAELVNSYGPGLLAKACASAGTKFVHISTDYVFSGVSKAPWSEAETLSPLSAYGRTKAGGERLVQEYYKEGSFIVRTAWLYSPWSQNFAKTMVRLALQETKRVDVVNDQIGQPTSASDLAAQIHKMIDRDVAPGIYHGTNSGQASWFEFAKYIFELSGADPDRVQPVDSSHYPRPARRPSFSVLGYQNWINEGIAPMRSWQEALQEVLPTIINNVSLGE